MSTPPLTFEWTGDSFKPASPAWQRAADKHYVIGERYQLVEYQDRSTASHNHFFAAVESAWQNLPEGIAVEYPTAEKLRKHALIKAGYADSQTFVCGSKAEAARLCTWLRPKDEFGIVSVNGPTVTWFTAKSQSMRAMGKEEFQRSKDAVLAVLADMIGTTTQALTDNKAA